MSSLTVTVIACGAMGAAVGRRLVRHGVTVLTSLEGRSAASHARADAAGLKDASDEEIIARSDLILSIVPPAEAESLALRFLPLIAANAGRPVFVDCNATGVEDMERIGAAFEAAGAPFVDGAIIGLPPKDEGVGPTFYFSGAAASAALVLGNHGLKVSPADGPIGAASALKLSYAGITKGLVAIAAAMILAAERAGAGPALKHELTASQPQLVARFATTLPDMYPKAYRWVDEMRSIAAFIGTDKAEALIYQGAAGLYERLSEDWTEERALIDLFLKR